MTLNTQKGIIVTQQPVGVHKESPAPNITFTTAAALAEISYEYAVGVSPEAAWLAQPVGVC